ncbi:fasciclin-like arabinogalactan protein 11 [Nicotiana tabacum]|uniref:Fasciclin-like arabinogalactan protein 11 n=1 Tax=Nicotiana tabacum TaxID=4097 RepID=A0A1S3X9R1_TOBAC|nr:fasciclin-like arabinogalactan protein 12 [Nicotiana tomentosiformis]XP_016436647.1 PREDICTED: fasciclin-like arabinogalactan protein 12 [Nicotiana tabacum]
MKPIFVSPLLFLFFFLLQCTCIFTQAPAMSPMPPAPSSPPAPISPPAIVSAPAPGPPGPPNVVKILGKAGPYSTFIKLLQITQEIGEITSLLNNSNSITMFVPSDGAFLNLKIGTLNSFSDQQKAELVKFHILPSYFSLSQFQTASNPLHTQAGGTTNREFPINITTNGTAVNITTGIVNASVSSTIYTDNQLAIYQVDKVLLPLQFFVPPAPAPAPSKPKKKDPSSDSASVNVVSSGATSLLPHMMFRAMVYPSCFFFSVWFVCMS